MPRITLIALGLLLALPATAQRFNAGENLLVDIPAGFTLAHSDGDAGQVIEEFIPEDETLQTWQELITLQFFERLGGRSPAAFLDNLSAEFTQACPSGQVGDVNAVAAGAYPAALVIATCPDSPRTEGTESFVAYAIGGQQRMYVLQYAWARLPSDADFAAARAFLATALVCDTTRPDAPCPGG